MSAVRSLFSTPRKDAGESRTRAAVLSMTSWPARKVRHEVQLLEKQDDQATVWCPAHVDIGESVWMEEGERAVKCDVKSLVATGGGYRLNLSVSDKTRRCDERTVCNTPGDLEWVDGFTRVRCPVRITNLTLHGVQVMLSRPARDSLRAAPVPWPGCSGYDSLLRANWRLLHCRDRVRLTRTLRSAQSTFDNLGPSGRDMRCE